MQTNTNNITQYIRRSQCQQIIYPIILLLLTVIITVQQPIFDYLHLSSADPTVPLSSVVSKEHSYINIEHANLYYTGQDYWLNGELTGHYYYELADNYCRFYILPASQTKDKDALTLEGVGEVLRGLDNAGFEYVVCDSPAGIEAGALMALYYADEAVVTTNPEVSSVRDSDRIIGILNSKSRRAVLDWEPVTSRLLLTRYVPGRVTKNEMLSVEDVQELLTIPLLGVIPESPEVLKASNAGNSIILNKDSDAGKAYDDAVERLLGNEVELRFITEKKGFFSKLFKR